MKVKNIHLDRERDISIMQVIPPNNELLLDMDRVYKKLHDSEEFKNIKFLGDSKVQFEYRGKLRLAYIYVGRTVLDDLKHMHHMSEAEEKRCKNTSQGLLVSIYFDDNYIESYLMQLKLLMTMIPNGLAVADYSSFQLLNGKWAKIQSQLDILGDVNYIYRGKTYKYDDSKYLVSTAGLKRCCGVELEAAEIPAGSELYPETKILDVVCKRIIEGVEDPNRNVLIKINGDISVLLEPNSDKDRYEVLKLNDRPDEETIDDYIEVKLINSADSDSEKLSLTNIREFDEAVINELYKPNPLLEKEFAQYRLDYLIAHYKEFNSYLNFREDDFYWFGVEDYKDGIFYVVNRTSEDKEVIEIHRDDVNDWCFYIGQDDFIYPDDIYRVAIDDISLNPILESNEEAFVAQLEQWYNGGESETVVDFLTGKVNLGYDVSCIYAGALINIGEYNRAIDALFRVRKKGKNDPFWLVRLVKAFIGLNNLEKAEGLINRALEIDSTYLPALEQRAVLLYYSEEFIDAKKIAQEVSANDKKEEFFNSGEIMGLYNMIGNCEYSQLHKEQKEKAQKLRIMLSNGAYRRVLKELRSEVKLSEDLSIIKAEALIELGKIKEAIDILESIDYDDPSYWFSVMGRAYDVMDDSEKLNYYEKKYDEYREASELYGFELIRDKSRETMSNDGYLRIIRNEKDELILLIVLYHDDVCEALEEWNDNHKAYPMMGKNLGDCLSIYFESKGFSQLSHEFIAELSVLQLKMKYNKDNIAKMEEIADKIFELIDKEDLEKLYPMLVDKVDWDVYDLSKKYDINNKDEWSEFRDINDDFHFSRRPWDIIDLIDNQDCIDDDTKFSLVCSLNNDRQYDRAFKILDSVHDEYKEDEYYNYVRAYALTLARRFDEIEKYCVKSIDSLSSYTGAENYILNAHAFMGVDDTENAKEMLAKIDIKDYDDMWEEQKESLEYLLNKYPELDEAFKQYSDLSRLENLIKEEKIEEAKELYEKVSIEDEEAINRMYNVCNNIAEFEGSLHYLFKAHENVRNHIWEFCVMFCYAELGRYDDMLKYVDNCRDYLREQFEEDRIRYDQLMMYAVICLEDEDYQTAGDIILRMWEQDNKILDYITDRFKMESDTQLTDDDFKKFEEDRKIYEYL